MYPFHHLPPPLTQAEFYILLALESGENYAYKLKARVLGASLGSVKLTPGTLYSTLARLHGVGWIDVVDKRATDKAGTSSVFYALSDQGRLRLKEEAARLSHAGKIMENAGLLENKIPIDIERLLLDSRSGDGFE